MSDFQNVLDKIEQNRFKKFNCIPFDDKMPRLSEYLPGIQQKMYYLVSGNSGSGKSQFADDFFMHSPIEHVINKDTDIKLKIFYYSFELDKHSKIQQWISKRLYNVYGIRASLPILNSVGKNRLSDDLFMAVSETESYFEKLEEFITIIDEPKTPIQILAEINKYAIENGKINENGIYIANNPNEYVIIIVDHYSFLQVPSGSTIKLTIEALSKGFVHMRNKYNYIPVPIQQQSAEKENVEHFNASKLEPSKDGLAESKLTFNDCDVALGIFSPYSHEIKTWRKYDITQLGDHYRNISIFKNRFGIPYVNSGTYFDGCVGYFKELPHPREINPSHYDMVKKNQPNW